MTSSAFERQLPYGVADLFGEEAARKSWVEAILRGVFHAWGYSEVIPPTFEYFEPLAIEASPQVREEIYRFFDRDGRTLALRADPTIPIARIVSTKLEHLPLPLRLSFIGSVFRYEEPRASRRREFTQAGVELIGSDTAAADAEGISLAVAALRAIGLDDLRLRVGSMELLGALLDLPDVSSDALEALILALDRKSGGELNQALEASALPQENRAALARLLELNGSAEILGKARPLRAVSPRAERAIDRLQSVARALDVSGCGDAILWDLAMVRGMAYYTGIVFEMFEPSVGVSIGSGGRYNNLLSHFGRTLPALGFAVGVERALAALAARDLPPVDLRPLALVEMADERELAARVAQARARGERIENALEHMTRDEMMNQARRRGAREVWFADGTTEVVE